MDIIKFLSGQPEGEIASEEEAVLSKLRIMAKNDPQHELWHFVQAPEKFALSMLEEYYTEGRAIKWNEDKWKEDYSEYPILHVAVEEHKFKIVSFLLQKGADPTVHDNEGLTILDTFLWQVITSKTEKTKKEAMEYFKELLQLLFHKENFSLSHLSLTHRTINSFKDADGNTILHFLMRSIALLNFKEIQSIVNLMLPYNPDFNATNNIGETPLHSLAACDSSIPPGEIDVQDTECLEVNEVYQEEAAELLLKNNTQPHIKNKFGITALEISKVFRRKKLSEMLEEIPFHSLNILHVKKSVVEKSTVAKVLDNLLPDDTNEKNSRRLELRKSIITEPEYILHHMIKSGVAINIIKEFLKVYKEALQKEKFDLHCKDRMNSNFTPLHFAITFQYFALVPLLLDYGADINAQDRSGSSALHLLAASNFVDIDKEKTKAAIATFKVILNSAKLNPNLQDNRDNTPLHILVTHGMYKLEDHDLISMVNTLLLHNKLDVNIKNKEDKTALHELVALTLPDKEKTQIKLTQMLIYHGAQFTDNKSDGISLEVIAEEAGNMNLKRELQKLQREIGNKSEETPNFKLFSHK